MPMIQLKVERGQITDVVGLPPEIVVEVLNYDVEKFEEKFLSVDEDGTCCQIKEWHAPE
jgi:hypothetical protein